MNTQIMEKKIEALEYALEMNTEIYYSVNLSKDVILNRKYGVNDLTGMPENTAFSDVIVYWGNRLEKEEREKYVSFFAISGLLRQYRKGKTHLSYTYRTVTVLSEPVLAEQHIIMFEDAESRDIFAITYIRNLMQQDKKHAYQDADDIVSDEQEYQHKLLEMAYQDALTKIGNRFAFMKKLSEYEAYSKAACVVADVNDLKLCNDRYGHQEGDKIIIDVADSIRTAFCDIGNCYRIGGDEFCVLIPNEKEMEMKAALERLNTLLEERNQQRRVAMSVAVGYAVREGMDENMEQLFNKADRIMYDKKYKMKKELSENR